jgi:uncharacterized damage-inducible protein DinB
MTISELLLPEFDQEMASTRRVLELVPDHKLQWKAHPKANTIGWNARHLAEIPGWTAMTMTTSSLDLAPPGGEPYKPSMANSRNEFLALFDQNVAAGRQALSAASDATFDEPWSLLKGGQEILKMSKYGVMRNFVLNHIIHHRAHLLSYLRMNDIPVPGMYGPSGDEGGL